MKAVILAGGLGTRLSEETADKPKPMVNIGGKPILWHIMKIYSMHGVNEFIICCGYKGYILKEYFYNYALHNSDASFNLKEKSFSLNRNSSEEWTVHCVDTGLNTQTGGRLKRIQDYIDDETFLFTYGDGVGDIDISKTIKNHKKSKKIATITAVSPPGRFGALKINDITNEVEIFEEKPQKGNTWINGGFFVLEPEVFNYISGDNMPWEDEPLKNITKERQLNCYKHDGFWQPMDTIREKSILNQLYLNGEAPWKIWED